MCFVLPCPQHRQPRRHVICCRALLRILRLLRILLCILLRVAIAVGTAQAAAGAGMVRGAGRQLEPHARLVTRRVSRLYLCHSRSNGGGVLPHCADARCVGAGGAVVGAVRLRGVVVV